MLDKKILKDKNLGKYIQWMKLSELKKFTEESIEKFGTEKKLQEANSVIDVMMAMLRKKNQIKDDQNNTAAWVELLVSAALIHNLFYDGTLPSLFMAREKLVALAKENKLPVNAIAAIFQAVEAQLGDETPVESCIPNSSSPNALFAQACWFVEELNGNKQMPACQSAL